MLIEPILSILLPKQPDVFLVPESLRTAFRSWGERNLSTLYWFVPSWGWPSLSSEFTFSEAAVLKGATSFISVIASSCSMRSWNHNSIHYIYVNVSIFVPQGNLKSLQNDTDRTTATKWLFAISAWCSHVSLTFKTSRSSPVSVSLYMGKAVRGPMVANMRRPKMAALVSMLPVFKVFGFLRPK